MNMRVRNITLVLATFTLLLTGCTKESVMSQSESDSDKVMVQIKTKAFIGSETEVVTIEKVRFILFQDGALLNNQSLHRTPVHSNIV